MFDDFSWTCFDCCLLWCIFDPSIFSSEPFWTKVVILMAIPFPFKSMFLKIFSSLSKVNNIKLKHLNWNNQRWNFYTRMRWKMAINVNFLHEVHVHLHNFPLTLTASSLFIVTYSMLIVKNTFFTTELGNSKLMSWQLLSFHSLKTFKFSFSHESSTIFPSSICDYCLHYSFFKTHLALNFSQVLSTTREMA